MLVLGGGMANTFLLAARTGHVGASLVEADMTDTASCHRRKCRQRMAVSIDACRLIYCVASANLQAECAASRIAGPA